MMQGSFTKPRRVLFVSSLALGLLALGRASAQEGPRNPYEDDPSDAGPPPEPPPPPPPPSAEPPPPPPAPPVEPAPPPVAPAPAPAPAPRPQPAPPPSKPPTATFPAPSQPARQSRPPPPRPSPSPSPSPPPPQTTPYGPSSAPSERAPFSPAPEATGPERDSSSRKKEDEDDSSGVFGPFRIGVLVGTGLPSVLSFGAAIKLTSFFGAGLNVGLIPAVKISIYGEAELSYQEYDVYGRIFPFGGAFFVGAGVGYATISGTFTHAYDVSAFQSAVPNLPNPLLVTSEGSVRTLVLTPAIGVQHTFKVGFTMGADAGLQIPIAPSDVTFNTIVPPSVPLSIRDQVERQYVEPNDQQVRDTLDTIGRAIVPTINLRIGWLL